jgi:alkylation response protein AidB-like acyl-CoA dehydrogenase
MGLWAPNHPVEFGGLGLSMVEHGLLSEALGRSPLGHLVFGGAGASGRQRRDPAGMATTM